MTASWWTTVPREGWSKALAKKDDDLRKLTHDNRCYSTAPIRRLPRLPQRTTKEEDL